MKNKKCKYCGEDYNPEAVRRSLGSHSFPYILGYCSAPCYTKALTEPRTAADKFGMNTKETERRVLSNVKRLCRKIEGPRRVTGKEAQEALDAVISTIFNAGYYEINKTEILALIQLKVNESAAKSEYVWRVVAEPAALKLRGGISDYVGGNK